MARASKYDPDRMPVLARQKMREGYTREQLAEYFGVHIDTIYAWQTKYSEFSDAIKSGADFADALVENSLFHKATGGIVCQHVVEEFFDKEGVLKKRKTVSVETPPDTAAAIFWLKNRRTDRWREKPQNDGDDADENGKPLRFSIVNYRKDADAEGAGV